MVFPVYKRDGVKGPLYFRPNGTTGKDTFDWESLVSTWTIVPQGLILDEEGNPKYTEGKKLVNDPRGYNFAVKINQQHVIFVTSPHEGMTAKDDIKLRAFKQQKKTPTKVSKKTTCLNNFSKTTTFPNQQRFPN